MTICVSVKVKDGIVLGTDSMTQITARLPGGKSAVIKSYENARKLFRVRGRTGVMTYGSGNLGPRSIESLVLEVSQNITSDDVEFQTGVLYEFLKAKYEEVFPPEQGDQPALGIYLGGYSKGSLLAEEWEFRLPDVEPKRVRPVEETGTSWRGIPEPLRRLYNGVDSRILTKLQELGVSEEILKQAFASDWKLKVVYDGMPVRDAIRLGEFLLTVTIGTTQFEMGTAPPCGGALQIAAILPEEGWKWIAQPVLDL